MNTKKHDLKELGEGAEVKYGTSKVWHWLRVCNKTTINYFDILELLVMLIHNAANY